MCCVCKSSGLSGCLDEHASETVTQLALADRRVLGAGNKVHRLGTVADQVAVQWLGPRCRPPARAGARRRRRWWGCRGTTLPALTLAHNVIARAR